MKVIDLRSDTVTKPSPEMRQVMARAVVGDDVLGDDPTINLLQEKVADLFQKEAALFVPSGTMANAVSILAHTRRGDEVIVEKEAHTFNYEAAGPAVLGGVQLNPLAGEQGILTALQIESVVRLADDVHQPPTRLICLENTHNRGGGKIYPLEDIEAISNFARKSGISMHLDGARLFNACVATGNAPSLYAQFFDSLMVCFSKGLGAPVGSIVMGSAAFIEKAHRYRKMLGGGMRQAGILAAAALYALEHNLERLEDDHHHAQRLAKALAVVDGFEIDPDSVETNIVIFKVKRSGKTAAEVVKMLDAKGVLMIPFGKYLVRAVTHLDVSAEDIEFAIQIIQRLFSPRIV
jgi:threonine aldolase